MPLPGAFDTSSRHSGGEARERRALGFVELPIALWDDSAAVVEPRLNLPLAMQACVVTPADATGPWWRSDSPQSGEVATADRPGPFLEPKG